MSKIIKLCMENIRNVMVNIIFYLKLQQRSSVNSVPIPKQNSLHRFSIIKIHSIECFYGNKVVHSKLITVNSYSRKKRRIKNNLPSIVIQAIALVKCVLLWWWAFYMFSHTHKHPKRTTFLLKIGWKVSKESLTESYSLTLKQLRNTMTYSK